MSVMELCVSLIWVLTRCSHQAHRARRCPRRKLPALSAPCLRFVHALCVSQCQAKMAVMRAAFMSLT